MEKQLFGQFQPFDHGPGASQGGPDTSWSVPWADLMMVMFVLFVVLFVYKTVHRDVRLVVSPTPEMAEGASPTVDPLTALIGRITAYGEVTGGFNMPHGASGIEPLFRSEDGTVTVVRDAENRIRMTLRGALAFAPGAAELNPQAAAYLDETARLLRVNAGDVLVQGYADESEAQGPESFRLSAGCAAAVAEHFITRHGLAPRRFIVTGRGAYRPESVPGAENGSERNRRVEIVILPGEAA